MNKDMIEEMEHALNNGNRFYTEKNDKNWNVLVEKGLATKTNGWDEESAYFRVTQKGKEYLGLTDYQLGKLRHTFGLDYARVPYRNYYFAREEDGEWEDMVLKGYADKTIKEDGVYYAGTLKALREVYRKNSSEKYYKKIQKF